MACGTKSTVSDLHPVYISEVERGTKAVSVEALWKISKALRVPPSRPVRAVVGGSVIRDA